MQGYRQSTACSLAHQMGTRLAPAHPDESIPLLDAPSRTKPKLGALFSELKNGDGLDGETRRVVRAIYVLGLLVNMMHASRRPVQLLYLQYLGFSSAEDISFYVWTEVIRSSVPVVGHAVTGTVAARIGGRYTLCTLCSFAICGILLIIQASALRSKTAYIFGDIALNTARSMRLTRIIVITEQVPAHQRTGVIATHSLFGPVGAILGPLVWILCEHFHADVAVGRLFRLNMYTVNYFVGAVLSWVIAIISWNRLPKFSSPSIWRNPTEPSARGVAPASTGPSFVRVVTARGTFDSVVNTKLYQRWTFLYFLVLMFSVDLCNALIFVGFQPILINHFHVDAKQLGYIYLIILLIALIPPVILAYISRVLEDRQIMMVGLVIKLFGVLFLVPIFGDTIHRWQAIVGSILIMKSSRFFYACSISLYSKLLGPLSNGTLLGMLGSITQIGPAVVQIFFAKFSVGIFGTYRYALLGLPLVFSILLMVWQWDRLDPDREFIRVFFRECKKGVGHHRPPS